MPRDEESIVDILVAAEQIETYLAGVDFDQFESQSEKQSAVLHQLLIPGEATKRLSPGFRAAHSSIPWVGMAGMRDRPIHAYDDIDLQLVWQAVREVLPPIVKYLRQLYPQEHD